MHQSASRMDAQPLSSPGAVRTHMQGRQHWQVHEEEELLDRELQDELLATVEEQEQALRSVIERASPLLLRANCCCWFYCLRLTVVLAR